MKAPGFAGGLLLIEAEMNKANLSCKRARVQRLDQFPTIKPTWH
jgi:hypothetical protein